MERAVVKAVRLFPFAKNPSGYLTFTLYFWRLGLPIILSLYSLLMGFFLKPYLSFESIFVFYTLIPAVCAWFGGLRSGLLATFILSFGSLLFLVPALNLSLSEFLRIIQPLVFFMATAGLISLIIDKARNFDEVLILEKTKLKLMVKLEEEENKYEKAIAEIKARDEFLSIASHELKTPLTVMLLQLQTALHNIRNVSLADFSVPKLMDMLESTEKQSYRLTKMIGDLLNVSLITTGKLDLELEENDLVNIVEEVITRIPSTMEGDNYPITFETTQPVLGVWDKSRIEQVVINLITNAIKYGNGNPIAVTVKKEGKKAIFAVKDHGVGIPKELQKQIFAKFERANNTKSIQGLGVGLYITNQIVQAHGGHISVESKLNEGSTFTVELPLETKISQHLLPVQVDNSN